MNILLIGGTPGTGKSTIANALASKLDYKLLRLGEIAKESKCLHEHDDERDTEVIDEDCLVDAILDILEDSPEDVIIEGHYIDLVPSGKVNRAFILRTHPDELKSRLEGRKYTTSKINENIEAEIFGVCQMDALDAFGEEKVFEVDTTELSIESTVTDILHLLESKETSTRFDWMELLEKEGKLEDYLQS